MALARLVRASRRFFPAGSTGEILAELRPRLCPHDESVFVSSGMLSTFLPSDPHSPAARDDPLFASWLDEMLGVWGWYGSHFGGHWDHLWISLFARLAKSNIGRVPWLPHLDWIFTKILNGFRLPVGSERTSVPFSGNLPSRCLILLPQGREKIGRTAQFIVSMLTPAGHVRPYLERLLRAVVSFVHPSNTGGWSGKLGAFLYSLCDQFVCRLHEEAKPEGESQVPPEFHLRREDRVWFTEALKPAIFLALFSKSPQMVSAASWAMKSLCYIAPELILPPLLDRVYPALETVTEAHQTHAALSALLSVARPLVCKNHFPEGNVHLLPLMHICLPGIDANDPIKTQFTLQFYMSVFYLVPLVDCSKGPAPPDATELDREVYASTASIEEFVMGFLDRVLSLMRTQVAAGNKRYSVERSLSSLLTRAVQHMCVQLSPDLLKMVVKRLFRFITTELVLENAKHIGLLCYSAARADPGLALATLLPYMADRVLDLAPAHATVHEAEADETVVDDELMWYLALLARLVKYAGAALLVYKKELLEVLHATVPLASRAASKLGCKMLRHTLIALVGLYPREYRSVAPEKWEELLKTPKRLFDMRGKSPGVEDVAVEWHVPSQPEIDFAEELLAAFFDTALDQLDQVLNVAADPNADVSAPRLRVALMCVRTVARVPVNLLLPAPAEEMPPVSAFDTQAVCVVPPIRVSVGETGDLERPPVAAGRYVRMCELLHTLTPIMLRTRESDVKNLVLLNKCIYLILCVRGLRDRKYQATMGYYAYSKQMLSNVLAGRKQHMRGLLVERILFQHLRRLCFHRLGSPCHTLHANLMDDLLLLATSAYAKVRIPAQTSLFSSIFIFNHRKRVVVDYALGILAPPAEGKEPPPHHSLKGALYILAYRGLLRYVVYKWDLMRLAVEYIMGLCSNDRKSVQMLVNHVFVGLHSESKPVVVRVDSSQGALEAAVALHPEATAEVGGIEAWRGKSAESLDAKEQRRRAALDALVDALVSMLSSSDTHWRYELSLLQLLYFLLPLRHFRADVAGLFARTLGHDSLHMRHFGLVGLNLILSLDKVKALTAPARLREDGFGPVLLLEDGEEAPEGDAPSAAPAALVPTDAVCPPLPGPRTDNTFLWFETDASARPACATPEAYESTIFVDKNYCGWNAWPQALQVYRPLSEQPSLTRGLDDASSWSAAIMSTLSAGDGALLTRFIALQAVDVDEAKGDPFSATRAEVFKGYARNFGWAGMERLLPELEGVMSDNASKGAQRLAAEMVGGLVRGMKHWCYADCELLWDWLLPRLTRCMENLSNEALEHWCTGFRWCVYDRDPRRLYRLLDTMFAAPLESERTSHAQHCNLKVLLAALEELSWRGTAPCSRLLAYLQPHLAHPYKLVREKISRCLYVIFRSYGSPATPDDDPRRDFVTEVASRLDAACSAAATTAAKNEATAAAAAAAAAHDSEAATATAATAPDVTHTAADAAAATGDESAARQADVRFAKTILQWLTYIFNEGILPHDLGLVVGPLLPRLFSLPELTEETELGNLCTQCLGLISQTHFTRDTAAALLDALPEAASSPNWHARRRVLVFLQVVTFRNLYMVDSTRVLRVLRPLLADPQLEVVDMAAITLSGMIRCGMVDDGLRQEFETAARTRIPKRRRRHSARGAGAVAVTPEQRAALATCLRGVLGLQAYLLAFPYDVPEWMPGTLVLLAERVNSPDPIRGAARKALTEFWRTHRDNFREMKHLFDSDQLMLLQDVLISPSYYA